jgi:putative transposase
MISNHLVGSNCASTPLILSMMIKLLHTRAMTVRYRAEAEPSESEPTAGGRRRYPSDLTDRQWQVVAPLIPDTIPGHFPREKYSAREMLNAILYVSKTGCTWRSLPHDFPPWESVYGRFRRWGSSGVLDKLLRALHVRERERLNRAPEPTLGIVDSQSVKTTENASMDTVGYDAGKKTKGRKRHVLVDVTGVILAIFISVGSVQDRDGLGPLLQAVASQYTSIQKVLVDGAYTGDAVAQAAEATGIKVEITKRNEQVKGFAPVRKRWIVERTFGWLNRSRRLSKDYERTIESSEGMVRIAMIGVLARRLGRPVV